MATATNDKPVRLGDLPVIKTNILENARQYDKGIIGGYNGTFPLTAATKGNIYLLPATNKFYMCITDYNGSNLTAPNANFEELSVWANRDKLENLTEIISLKKEEVILPEITIKNAFRLTIVGNVGLLSIDGLSFPKLKSGFNPFAKIPEPYKIISTANGCFYDNSAKNEAHIRLFDDGTFNLYSNVSKENEVLYSFFSIVFLLKKVF